MLERERMMLLKEAQATGLATLQLEQLCQADQIEETMRLLFRLNHWAKARERLFFADRQGLYLIKSALLRHLYACGSLEARAYINGKEGFGADLSFEIAADIATEGFLWRLEEIATDPEEREDGYTRLVLQLYTRITGKTNILLDDVEKLEAEQVQNYILACLRHLEREALTSGQPIPHKKLTELCVAPSDLLLIRDRRYHDLGDWCSWEDLDASDLRKLDPEGLSLIAFDYISPYSYYTFHLPLRLAEEFVPGQLIAQLKCAPWSSRECGEYYGRPITEEESLQHPIETILGQLGVNVSSIFPHLLSSKEDFFFARAMRTPWGEDRFGEDEDDEDEDDEEQFACWQHLVKHASHVDEPDSCPLCHKLPHIVPCLARLAHWQQEHPGQDLTFCQARWILDSTLEKKVFYEQYPPDYRAPHERNWGTRYWKVETLRTWVMEKETGVQLKN